MSIDVSYYSFSPSRADVEWPFFIEDVTVLRKKHFHKEIDIVLNDRQRALEKEYRLGTFSYEPTLDADIIMRGLKEADLEYGSITNNSFEDPKLEFDCLEALIKACVLTTEDGVPLPKEWVRLFEEINNEIIQKAVNFLIREYRDWSPQEAQGILIDYLQSVRPVAQDLKANSDAVFLRAYGGAEGAEPKQSEILLLQRAQAHANVYQEFLSTLSKK